MTYWGHFFEKTKEANTGEAGEGRLHGKGTKEGKAVLGINVGF